MTSLRRWLSTPLRRWRTLGFGVHSPLAFDFVTKVVGERWEYYAYEQLRQINDDNIAELALIFRCVLYFKPQSVAVIGKDSHVVNSVKLANSICTITEDYAASMVIIDGPHENEFTVAQTNSVIIVRHTDTVNATIWQRISKPITYGMTFSDGRMGIAILRHDLPRQSFKIDIR